MSLLPKNANNLSFKKSYRKPNNQWHLDSVLLISLLLLIAYGLIILYSASNQDIDAVIRQMSRLFFAFILLIVLAQIPPENYRRWAPLLFGISMCMLLAVLVLGHIAKGGKRWLDLGLIRFQPSEFMKLIIPMMCAWYLSDKPLPPKANTLVIVLTIIAVPALLIAKQPDLGTALLIGISGACVLLLAGLSWNWVFMLLLLACACSPVLWHFMHDYQRQRVLTFLNPERDPLGAGYHIIQSKIAIGSGGFFGKGWLNGTQSHLQFLPEHSTDFIFSVCGEEFGFLGSLVLIILYCVITARCFYISSQANDTFGRLFAGGLTFMFFISAFVNIGMVTGILPVVGVPLPLVSYGGTSSIILIAGFGILMSIHTHKRLVRS